MKTHLRLLLALSLLPALVPALSAAGPAASGDAPIAARATTTLKQCMSKFGAMVAGLEILKIKEKTIDWGAIDITLKEMDTTLQEMQKVDADHRYKEFTDTLAAGLVDLKMQAAKRDKKIFDGVDKLTNTCFQCHAQHRPADFIMPKPNQRMTSQPQ